jgi:P-type conjugative transfer protein TrbJ
MRKILMIVLMACLAVFIVLPAQAFVVYDPTNYLQNLKTAISTAQMLLNQAQQLQNDLLNLTKLDDNLAATNLATLKGNLSDLATLQKNLIGLVWDYRKIQQAWDAVYKDFTYYNGLSGTAYANQANTMLNQTNRAIYDAMKAQGLTAQTGKDAENLQQLLTASQSAPGSLAAAQAGNQIAGMQAQQLLRIETVMTASYRVESTYAAERVQREAGARANAQRLQLKGENTLQNAETGAGFPHFE